MPNSWVGIDANNRTLDSSGVFVITVPYGKHSIEVPQTVRLGADTIRVFKQWSDGYPSSSRDIDIQGDVTYYLVYEAQYLLSLRSELGAKLTGRGWYKEGSTAMISIDPKEISEQGILGILGAKRAFESWVDDNGETLANTPTATIVMNHPYNIQAKWRLVEDEMYLRLGIIAAVIFVVLAVLLLLSRRKPPPSKPMITGTTFGVPIRPVTTHGVSPRQAPILLRVPLIGERKFCMHCGASIDSAATRCTSCGRET